MIIDFIIEMTEGASFGRKEIADYAKSWADGQSQEFKKVFEDIADACEGDFNIRVFWDAMNRYMKVAGYEGSDAWNKWQEMSSKDICAAVGVHVFDCAFIWEERWCLYKEMTPDNLYDWYKKSKGKFPINVFDAPFSGKIYKDKEDGEYHLRAGDYNLRIGKTITKRRWVAITKFIVDYLAGELEKRYHSKEIALA